MFLFDNGQLTCCMLCKSRRQLHWFSKWIIFQICSSRCDKSNAEEIVFEMLAYLETADYSIREEMVLKVNFKLCKHFCIIANMLTLASRLPSLLKSMPLTTSGMFDLHVFKTCEKITSLRQVRRRHSQLDQTCRRLRQ